MSDKITFYTHPMSRGRIVRWMLEETGQPYDTEVVDYGEAMKAPDYLAINPMGKVPALRHGDTVVTECAAICAYLADAFPDTQLAPAASDRLRGPYYRWLFFAAGPLEAATTNHALEFKLPPDRQAMAGYGSLSDVLSVLEQELSGRAYIVGDGFTAADLYLSAHVGWGMQFGTIDKRPVFESYHERCTTRPAAERANDKDNALMPEHPHPSA